MKSIDFSPFPAEEYKTRVKKARKLMDEKGVDVLLVSSREHIVYFTGLQHIGWQIYSTRTDLATVIPREGDVISIVPGGYYAAAEKQTWVENRVWGDRCPPKFKGASPTLLEAIKQLLEELRLSKGTIGMELGPYTRIGWCQADFEAFRNALPKANIIDASEILWRLRSIKSDAEIDAIRKACAATDEAFRVGFESMRPGMTERELGTLLYVIMTEQTGYRPAFVVIRSGLSKYDMVSCPPFDKKMEKGDIVVVDLGATYKDYMSDFMRMACIGAPTKEQQAYFDVELSSQIAGVEAVRPGIKAKEICNACVRVIEEKGYANKVTPVPRVGHGIGLEGGEPPRLTCESEVVMEPGMIIAVEPIFTDLDAKIGSFAIEDNILVTETGREVLSKFPKDLWIVD
jgi:Xaa-Pro aminopeptidase